METVLFDQGDGVAEITLNRPDKLNAFNEAMHRDLFAILSKAAEDADCRAILLTGAGRGFCAGQDLRDRKPDSSNSTPDLGATIEALYNPLLRLIRGMEKPIICAVNGVAAGAGANIALACDIVLAAQTAKFIQAFCKIGLIPDSGGSWMLPRLVGEARAKMLCMTGVPVTADQAMQWGMIWRSVDESRLLEEARSLAGSLAQGPTYGLSLTKQIIHAAATNSFDQQLDLERDTQRKAGLSSDYAEGVAAFLEKRPARFTGQKNTGES